MSNLPRTVLFLSLPLALLAAPAEALFAQATTTSAALPAAADDTTEFHYLNPDDFLPRRTFAQPPVPGSPAEDLELARIKALIAAATPERLEKAKWDGEHEDPSAFNETLGIDLAKLPATWALLTAVQGETAAIIVRGKDTFRRLRPYSVDLNLRTCGKGNPSKAPRSYPSGHAGMGYSVGWALAKLLPPMAPAILSRADDFALSRELCAAHFHSDLEASHVIATLVADRLLADPRLADKVAAARRELAGAGLPTQ